MPLWKKISGGSLILAISSVLSRFLGVYRDHLLASKIGAGPVLDAYFAAFRIPDLIYTLLIIASISVLFLPIFQKHKEKNNLKEAWDFSSKMFNTLLLTSTILAFSFILAAPNIVNIYLPGLSIESKQMTTDMLRIMMFSPVFFMISSIVIAIQNAYSRFFTQALAPIVYNLCIISSIILFYPENGVKALALGVIMGAFLQALIQIPFLSKSGFQYSFKFLSIDEIKEYSLIVFPRILAISVGQIALTLDTFLSSRLESGSISFINLATNIQSMPFGVIAISISITSFALLTKNAAYDNKEEFSNTLRKSINKISFFIFPAVLGLLIVLPELVRLIFEYNNFKLTDSKILIQVCQILILAVLFEGFIPILSRAYHAMQRTWTPFFCSLLGLVVNIVASIYLSTRYGVLGIAYGTFLGILLNSVCLFFLANNDFKKIVDVKTISKNLVIAFLMYFFLIYLKPLILNLHSIFIILLLTVVGGIIYFGLNRKNLKDAINN